MIEHHVLARKGGLESLALRTRGLAGISPSPRNGWAWLLRGTSLLAAGLVSFMLRLLNLGMPPDACNDALRDFIDTQLFCVGSTQICESHKTPRTEISRS